MRGRHWLSPAEVWIGCGAQKAEVASRAIDLYIGPVFQAHRRIAVQFGVPIFILSALHGLIPADEVLEPYEASLTTADAGAWGQRVAAAAGEREGLVFVLAGRRYIEPWRPLVRRPVVVGLEGASVGQRRRAARTC